MILFWLFYRKVSKKYHKSYRSIIKQYIRIKQKSQKRKQKPLPKLSIKVWALDAHHHGHRCPHRDTPCPTIWAMPWTTCLTYLFMYEKETKWQISNTREVYHKWYFRRFNDTRMILFCKINRKVSFLYLVENQAAKR